MGDYRKYDVYMLACELSDRVANAVRVLPRRMSDKADQLRRAADSIHEAIAEGSGLGTDAQLLKYLRIALGSANECEDELQTLFRRGLLAQVDFDLLAMIRRLCAMIAKFIMRVEGDIARGQSTTRRQPRNYQPAIRKTSEEPRADAIGREQQRS
jgi:four helix bundle protein